MAFLFSHADVAERKGALRAAATAIRRSVHEVDPLGGAAEAVRNQFLASIHIEAKSVIGGYWPIGTELDVLPLLTALHERGHVCGLPLVHKRRPLSFHRWRPSDKLVPGIFGIPMPDHTTPRVEPDILIAPMLAFDRTGHRVGYGGGYYDRTVADIRGRKRLLVVGVAYAAQEVEKVPSERFDQRLDWIVTEKEVMRADRRRFPRLRRFFMS